MRARWALGTAAVAVAVAASACMPGPDIRISTFAGTGVAGFSGDGGPASAARVAHPFDLDTDSAGNVYIADTNNRRVRRVDATTGTITTVAGDGTSAFDGDDQPATEASVIPYAIAFDAQDNLFIADRLHDRVRRVDAVTGTITTVAGGGNTSPPYEEDPESEEDPWPILATDASLGGPSGVDVDDDGNLYLALADDGVVIRVEASDATITHLAGPYDHGHGDAGPALEMDLNYPEYVTAADDGVFYVNGHERVYRYDPDTQWLTTVIGDGGWGFTGDGGPAVDAQVSYPNEVVLDDLGNLYLADGENGRVRMIHAGTGIVTTIAGTDEWEFNGDDQPPTAATLQFPTGLTFTADGSLLISSGTRIRQITVGGAIGGVIHDSSNQVLAGTTVELYTADDLVTPIATDVTDSSGWYGFSVRPGSYRVRFVGDASHVGSWWSGASTGDAATPITIGVGAIGGSSDAVTADATLASP